MAKDHLALGADRVQVVVSRQPDASHDLRSGRTLCCETSGGVAERHPDAYVRVPPVGYFWQSPAGLDVLQWFPVKVAVPVISQNRSNGLLSERWLFLMVSC